MKVSTKKVEEVKKYKDGNKQIEKTKERIRKRKRGKRGKTLIRRKKEYAFHHERNQHQK